MLGVLSWLLLDAAGRLQTSQAKQTARITVIVVLAWAVAACSVAAFVPLSFPVFLPMALVPITLGTLAVMRPPLSEVLSQIRLAPLIAAQFYRNAGAIFLYLYYTTGSLSWGFARNAGWGDVATGVLALPVAWLVWKRAPYASMAVIGWCSLGIADLIVAPMSALYFGVEQLVQFPINTVPLFLGPPLGIFLQIVVLRAWWLQRKATQTKAD